VSDDDEGQPRLPLRGQEQIDHRFGGGPVELSGRLVGEEEARSVDQRPSDPNTLALPTGELVGQLVLVIAQPDLGE
jgi:hypothetical protein